MDYIEDDYSRYNSNNTTINISDHLDINYSKIGKPKNTQLNLQGYK